MNDIQRLRNDLKNKIYEDYDERREDMHKLSSYETLYKTFWNNNDGIKGGNSPKCKNKSKTLKKAFCCCKKRSKNNKTKK